MTSSLEAQFRSPGPAHRPLQIVHGFDRFPDVDAGLARLSAQGLGGVVANVSLGTDAGGRGYMKSPERWDVLRRGMAAARARGLTTWLYDEEGYPSGAAGGLVLDGHPELEARAIGCVRRPVRGPARVEIPAPQCSLGFVAAVAVSGSSMEDRSSEVSEHGTLRCELPAGEWDVLYLFEKAAYEGTHAAGNVHANRRYINVLEPAAVRRFIDVTHEAYLRELGHDLGGARAFFTDEPSLMSAYVWPLPPNIQGKVRTQDPLLSDDRSPMIAWSSVFAEEFRRRRGYDIRPRLAELFIDVGPGSRVVREDYRQVVGELFADTYFGMIGDWCAAHGVDSTGHVLVEESLLWHVAFLGDLFALARRMSFPGIDMLDSDPRSILAGEGFMVPKQVSSAAHLAGRLRVMSESSDWFQGNEGRRATEAELRGTTNLQYLLGVTTIASYHDAEMRGSAYAKFTEHAARLGVMLTAGRHDARVAVLYPVRSVQGRYLAQSDPPLPPTQPPDVRAIVAGWTETCRWLLVSQVDFDCIDERALAEGDIGAGALRAGAESYATVVLPPLDRLSPSSLAALARLLEAGGNVVVVRDQAVPPLSGLPTGHGGIVVVTSVTGLGSLRQSVLRPTVRLDTVRPDILCTRHVLPSGPLYFLVNASPEPASFTAAFDESGSYRTWDPDSGETRRARRGEGGTPMALDLAGYSSVFVSISDDA